jgi:hypothetical protein
MLVQKGHISQEIGLYASLQQIFPTAFFAGGKPPTSDFKGAFHAVCSETSSRATFQRRAISRTIARTAVDLHGLLDMNANRFFKQKSLLRLYREADWVPERIPDEEVPVFSALGIIRIGHTKIVADPATGKRALENTPLVGRARFDGLDDETMIQMSSLLQDRNTDQTLPQALLASLPKGYSNSPFPEYKRGSSAFSKGISGDREMLNLLKLDIINDISGEERPLSSLNYVWVTARFMLLFHQIEDELKRLRNPLWIRAYEQEPLLMREKRLSLTALVLAEEDDECMEVMARVFQNPRPGFMQHIYWEDLDSSSKVMSTDAMDHDEVGASCTVM